MDTLVYQFSKIVHHEEKIQVYTETSFSKSLKWILLVFWGWVWTPHWKISVFMHSREKSVFQ